ncbi:MAG: hypothetical protein GF344_15650 [Chitinivibrionales bacterium]|nr:hypothetical protein [Chitinivibrionales bacterium]MBD3358135.1 hypothetical protein [Chitinivibrionales bacterium]
MTNTPDSPGNSLDREKAEKAVRSLWIAFNNAGLYGEAHPLTDRSIGDLDEALRTAFSDTPSLTMHVEQDFLACEEWRVQKRAYGPRMMTRFKDAKIQSLTFYPEIGRDDLAHILAVLNAGVEFPTVDSMAAELNRRSVRGYRFNYVTYQKVTLDESIVHKNLHAFVDLFNNSDGDQADGALSPETPHSPPHLRQQESRSTLMMHLRALREKIGRRSFGAMPSTEELVETLSSLRSSVIQELQVQAAQGKIADTMTDTFTEVEALTFEVILRIVREEYQKGELAAEQLAILLQRLVPDRRDLKRLLPLLKRTLLDEGMPLEEYLTLVRALGNELQGEGVMEVLAEAGHELGVTPDEVVAELRRDPKTAVSLILLAAEIKSAGFRDEEEFADTIQQYIDTVVSALGGDSLYVGQDTGTRTSDPALSALEAELAARIQSQSIPHSARDRVMSSLARTETFAQRSVEKADIDTDEPEAGIKIDATRPSETEDLLTITKSIAVTLRDRGYTDTQLLQFASLTKELGAAIGSDYDKLREFLLDFRDVLMTCPPRYSMDNANADQVRRTLVSLEGRLRELLSKDHLDEKRAEPLIAAFGGHLAALVEKPPKESNDQAAASLADNRSASLDSALAVKGYSLKDIARFKGLAEEMKVLVGPGIEDTRVLLAEFLEQTQGLPVVDTGTEDGAGGGGAVDESLARLEEQFLSYLHHHGLEDKAIELIGEKLSHRLAELLVKPDEARRKEAGAEKRLKPRTVGGTGKSKLHGAVLRPKDTRMHIEREIARCVRYRCTFACVSITATALIVDGMRRQPEKCDMVFITNAVYERLQNMLRTPDLIGTVGSVSKNHLIVLLPMTDKQGGMAAEERIRKNVEGITIVSGQITGTIEVATSISSFAGAKAIKTASFLRRVRADHKTILDGGEF